MLDAVGEKIGVDQNGIRRSQGCVILEEKGRGDLGSAFCLVLVKLESWTSNENSHFSNDIILLLLVLCCLLRFPTRNCQTGYTKDSHITVLTIGCPGVL